MVSALGTAVVGLRGAEEVHVLNAEPWPWTELFSSNDLDVYRLLWPPPWASDVKTGGGAMTNAESESSRKLRTSHLHGSTSPADV